jgi:AAA+ ATPase superfamily predicted ATPase
MEKNRLAYKQYVAFINRENQLNELRSFIDREPFEILFIHGPKSSGKTTLLYEFFEQLEKEQPLDVKFLNLRKIFTQFTGDYSYKDFLSVLFNVEDKKEKKGKLTASIDVGFFKIDSEIEKKMQQGRADPFKIMEKEFIRLKEKEIKPILIIDELQKLDNIYLNNGKDRRLIIELFNFFVAMTKESHLAHIIIASSDGYFLNTVYNDSRLKQTSKFYKVDFLAKEDVMEWLLDLEKYSKIKDYKLTREDAEKIWDTVGGSMWEIHDIPGDLFDKPIDKVLTLHKKKMKGIIAHYTMFDKKKREILQVIPGKILGYSDNLSLMPRRCKTKPKDQYLDEKL